MPPRRVSTRFRLGLFGACIAVGAFLTAEPRARSQAKGAQFPSVTVPRVTVPRATVPRPNVPTAKATQNQRPMDLPVMSAEQAAAFVEAAEKRLPYLPGQVLVKFKAGVGPAGHQRALGSLRGQPDPDRLEWIGEVAIVKDASQPDARILARQLARQPDVEYAEPNYLMQPLSTPNDPSYSSRQWNLINLNMSRAWDITAGGSSSIVVAVIDTGITTIPAQNITVQTWNGSAIVSYVMPVGISPDFDTTRFVNPRDFTISTTSPPSLVIDTDSHGTHVAGTVGENTNNGVALAGIAYRTTIMPLKACQSYWDVQFARSASGQPGYVPFNSGGCPSAATAAAIRFAADNGAKVINYSIGGTSPNTTTRDALAYAVSKGVFIAIANGNEYVSETTNPIVYPAFYAKDFDGVMSVAATNASNNRASYSTTGSHTEIAAPGGDSANRVWQATILASDSNEFSVIFPRFDRYEERGLTGTSMASPHVAGTAALLMSRGITDPAAIEALLRKSAKDLGTAGRDNSFGFGLVQPFAALFGQGIRR